MLLIYEKEAATNMIYSKWLCSLVSMAIVSVGDIRAGADEREAIWTTFQARQQAAETAEVVWNKQFTLAASSANRFRSLAAATQESGGDVVSPSHTDRFFLSGDRARYETWISSFGGEKDGEQVPSIDAYDGKRHQSLTRGTHGTIKDLDSFDGWLNVHLTALVLSLRPLRPEAFGPTPGKWAIDQRRSVVDGHECIVLVQRTSPRPDLSRIRRVMLDPERQYLPLRYEAETGGYLSLRVEMRYEQTHSPEWVPSSWTAAFYRGGDISEQSLNELKEVVLGLDLPDETFTVDYPPGAEVTRVGNSIPPGRLAPSTQHLVMSKSGSLVPRRQEVAQQTMSGWGKWPAILGAVGMALLGGALLLWRRRMTAG